MALPKLSFQQSVLFIDDQSKFENLIRSGLLNFPGQIEFCPSKVTAVVECLRKETPDLIVCTLEFVEGGILDLIKKSNGYFESVPSIYLSEPHLADIEAEMAKLGSFNLMKRHSDPLELIQKMTSVISENAGKEKPTTLKITSAASDAKPANIALEPNWAESVLKNQKK